MNTIGIYFKPIYTVSFSESKTRLSKNKAELSIIRLYSTV